MRPLPTLPTPDIDAGVDRALAAGFDRAWALLAAAPGDPASGLRWPVVATIGRDGPDARVMVLRAVDRAHNTLAFYSDHRAAKIAALAADPRVAITGYDTTTRLQLRLTGIASVTTDGAAADAAWAAIASAGRTAYQSILPPGTLVAGPPPVPPIPPDAGRESFAVVSVQLERFEWLDLSVPGHRRALHVRDGSTWRGRWLVP